MDLNRKVNNWTAPVTDQDISNCNTSSRVQAWIGSLHSNVLCHYIAVKVLNWCSLYCFWLSLYPLGSSVANIYRGDNTLLLNLLTHCTGSLHTAVRLVYNPFSQFGPQLELYSQLQLSLWSDLITCGVPNST